MSLGRRLDVLLLVLGAGAFTLAVVGGLYQALRTEGGLPPIHGSYSDYINDFVKRKDFDGALQQMRMAVEVDVEQGHLVLPYMVQLAHAVGENESEIFALRRLARIRPDDVDTHGGLASALLDRDLVDGDTIAEAQKHAEMALALRPDSATAFLDLGSVAFYRGEHREAFSYWEQALELSPARIQEFQRTMLRRHPDVPEAQRALREPAEVL
jgi:tetratricopeptide (TPR) repeat protein